jgi:hypothetical protein
MEKHFYNPENIEAYLDNKLSASERSFFENELSKDPLLQNEINLQKDIIETLKTHRKAELKNRLNNIEVGMDSSYAGLKFAASLLLSGLISYGIYSFVSNEKESNVTITENYKELQAIDSKKTEVKNTTAANASETANVSKESETKKNTGTTATPTNNTAITVKKGNRKFTAPQAIENLETDQIQKDENTKLPDGKIAQVTETKSEIDVSIDDSNDKKFHYKYHDNKLFLYGNFNSQTYEIIELNTYKGKQVYLYYNNDYYQLNSNKLEISPLQKITDKEKIEELNKFN